ncbi:aminotransferase class I/II-fold pyridoxal phosphate-dependent enzyme [Streptomyces sp. NPDC050619]|uniref:aminotransferase class I/II-fold pyridoxal phosphate-dependent enzyme n=1 Tax=Streptomyces sp. NPDC050619 TaxID=3157214 RepID=UPI003413B151
MTGLPTEPQALAVESYRGLSLDPDRAGMLNLAWTTDEAAFLAADVFALVADELAAEAAGGLPSVRDYRLQDPYGEQALTAAVDAFFGLDGGHGVSAGAGVGPLLRELVDLGGRSPILTLSETYPDFPAWAARRARACLVWQPADAGGEDAVGIGRHVAAALRAHGASLIFLERPALRPAPTDDLAVVEAIGRAVAGRGAHIVIDESNANYCPPEFSAATLTSRLDNLIVVRGLSKAYGLGGVRLGYCVSSAPATEQVCRWVAPLQASSLALRIGRGVLAMGDIAQPLRARVSAQVGAATRVARQAGLAPAPAGRGLPYLLFPPDDDRPDRAETTLRALAEHGVQGKAHVSWGARGHAGTVRIGRISVPLDADRAAQFARRLGAVGSDTVDQADGIDGIDGGENAEGEDSGEGGENGEGEG